MSDTITFYYNPMSRARMAHWMLEEVGAKYDVKVLSFEKKEHKSAEFLHINPMGKLPTIVHRGVVITETAAICTYLADAFPEAGLAPKLNDAKRGTYLRWMFFTASCFEAAIIDKMLKRPSVEKPGALAYGSYEDTMRTLETAIAPGPFVLGDQFSAVDVYLASQIGFGNMTKAIELSPTLKSYVARCSDRPAHKRFMEKTNAYLPKP
jgi:glutathione S-transferase